MSCLWQQLAYALFRASRHWAPHIPLTDSEHLQEARLIGQQILSRLSSI
jgi:hypothetical protein